MLTLSDASSFMDDTIDGAGGGGKGQLRAGDPAFPAFSLVINGHSLVHALEQSLELLFLGVAEHCNCKY